MSWPQSQDYNEAIQSPPSSFADPELRKGQAATNAFGLPMPRSGNFADVYEVRCANGSSWAVKCFTREVSGLRDRYQEISRSLQQAKLPFTVEFTYLEQGIRIRSDWYPILKMQWVEGFTLNEFVRQQLDKPAMLGGLLQIWTRMATRLRETGIAHADLQHGNVLLVPGSTASSVAVKLIDYDGMFVPALSGKKSGEVGHPSYQHPQRLREGIYSPEVDRFPVLLIATALRAIRAKGKSLWDTYDNGDNLLFRQQDLEEPTKSALFSELLQLPDPADRFLVEQLIDATKKPLAMSPLLEDMQSEPRAVPARAPNSPSSLTSKTPASAPTVVAKGVIADPRPVSADAPALGFTFDEPEVEAEAANSRSRRTNRQRQKSTSGKFYLLGGVAVTAAVLLMGGIGLGVWAASGGIQQPDHKSDSPQASDEPKHKEKEPLKDKTDVEKPPKQPRDEPARLALSAPDEDGFLPLFNGKDLTGWRVHNNGDSGGWSPGGPILCAIGRGQSWLVTEKEYSDFELRLDYKITQKGDSGVALRAPMKGDPAFEGIEIQIRDDARYPQQRDVDKNGSIYDVVAPSIEGMKAAKPFGEWNQYRIIARGRHITVELNGIATVDANLDDYVKPAGARHPGLIREKGRIGLQSCVGRAEFRNISIKELPAVQLVEATTVEDPNPKTPVEPPSETPSLPSVVESDPIRVTLDKARRDFDSAREKHRKMLLDSLAQAEEGARSAGNKSRMDTIKIQRDEFEKGDVLPSVGLAKEYQQLMDDAQVVIQLAFERAIAEYKKEKMGTKADEVKKEKKSFFESRPPDALRVGSVWRGSGEKQFVGEKTKTNYGAVFRVTERDGKSFKAQLTEGPDVHEVHGTVEKESIQWTVGAIKAVGRMNRGVIKLEYGGTDNKKPLRGDITLQVELK